MREAKGSFSLLPLFCHFMGASPQTPGLAALDRKGESEEERGRARREERWSPPPFKYR
jgi:hypothetical protein